MPRGGRRAGRPGVAYGERTDLNTQRAPVAIPGQQRYGAQADQLRSQRAVPTGAQPIPTVQPTTGAASPTAPPAATTPIIPLNAPTTRPNEPLTAGSPSGPGPGPTPMPTPPSTADDLLRAVAPTSPELAQLYSYLSRGGQ